MANSSLVGSGFLSNYAAQCSKLAKTMVIKFEAEAQSLNKYLQLTYGQASVDLADPSSWKYYLNISGQYHITDTAMKVISLDTLEEIDFTRENMAIHSATKVAYEYGGRYYYSIVNRYPTQENLIRGILLPVDIDQAIEAEDFTILAWPSELVEPQETSLIQHLQDHVNNFVTRWYLPGFNLSDNYYDTIFYCYLVMSLPSKISNLRLRALRTRQAHSFHVREALASHFRLDEHYSSMTHEQRMWLYKNLPYVRKNLGKTDQFGELIDVLLTLRNIPLASYLVRQSSLFNDQHEPIISVYREPVNILVNASESNTIGTDTLIDKESALIYGNPYHLEGERDDLLKDICLTDSSILQTKDLESSMVDYSDAFPETRTEVYLREWFYLSLTGKYLPYVRFNDPKTGEGRTLRSDDAAKYIQYALLKTMGVQVTKVPNTFVWRHRLQPKATVAELMSVETGIRTRELQVYADYIHGREEVVDQLVSITSFNAYAERQFQNTKAYWKLQGLEEDHRTLGELKGMTNRNYGVTFFEDDRDLQTWMAANSLPEWDYTQSQAEELIQAIFEASTGYSADAMSPSIVQKAMIATLVKILSYSVQIISEINSSAIIPLNWTIIRPSSPDIQTSSDIHDVRAIDVMEVDARTNSKVNEELELSSNAGNIQVSTNTHLDVTLGTDVDAQLSSEIEAVFLNQGIYVMGATYPGYSESVDRQSSYYGKELFQELTNEQRLELLW